ncbi:MAG: type II secretion system minor pseudopilin GspJ [Marinobacter sp.]|nr:type II secretion system minor pseudopilin GspJ [Marinobacter sp.]
MSTPLPRSQRGFTLMEVLIAVTVTAVIGLGVWQVVGNIALSRDRVQSAALEFDGVQRTMLLLERDFSQLINRPVRDIYGDPQPALTTRDDDFMVTFTRQGWRNPTAARRSELQRVAYEYTGDQLRRRYWVTLDQGPEDNSRDQLLLSDVTAFSIRFVDHEGNWQETWPPDAVLQQVPDQLTQLGLPKAAEITIEHDRYGQLRRLFLLPDFDFSAVQQAFSGTGDQPGGEGDGTPPEEGGAP